MGNTSDILAKAAFSREDIISLLRTTGLDKELLFKRSVEVKEQQLGAKVYFRGLIEFSNVCGKNCLYCGIRKSNGKVTRYTVSDDEIVSAARLAHQHKYGSIVLQSGELVAEGFTCRVEKLLKRIHRETSNELRVTLSCGEQSSETYRRWLDAGAQRYLLRIESSNPNLYKILHPDDGNHSWERRLQCLCHLRDLGYQVGTGVMIGLPFQTLGDLADDLLFMKRFEIDMVGMGPYVEHVDTPFHVHRGKLLPQEERLDLALKMIAVLRLMMPEINIASATALQAIDPLGREKAIQIGANVIMPNITPGKYRNAYKLYENKPCTDENAGDCTDCLEARISLVNNVVAYGEWGDSAHYAKRIFM